MRWYYACKVNEYAVFFKGIYTLGNSRTTGLVRPNIQKKIRDIWVHEMILACKVHEDSVFFKGIYTPRELTHCRTGSPEHPKENNRYMRIWDDIMHVKYTNVSRIFQRNLYSRELTRGRAGSPENPKGNNRYMRIWDDIMHVKYTNLLFFSKESILQGIHARLDWFARTSKRK